MASKNPDNFRRERATELRELAQILLKQQICRNSSPLDKAAAMCRDDKPKGKNSWGYHLNGLLFRIKTPRHTLPRKIGDYLDVELSVSLKGVCEEDSDDPFQDELSVSIVVSTNEVSAGRKNLCAWHLDRHILEAGDHETEEVHPLYHFQYGGKRMYGIENLGQVLLLDPPRLLHPPLDAILAVDFVLSNFSGAKWKKLREDGNYRNMITDAQKLFWKPYVKSLFAAGWGSAKEREDGRGSADERKAFLKQLWPNLVVSESAGEKLPR